MSQPFQEGDALLIVDPQVDFCPGGSLAVPHGDRIFEAVNRDVPFNGLRWFFDHAETVAEPDLERIKALGGGIAIQDRMAFQGEYFIDRYGADAAGRTPPITKMLATGLPVGAGTDATRVASYNPWVSLYWMVAGKTVGGTALYPEANRLDRTEALRRYTVGSAWFSGEEDKKGSVEAGKLADLAVLSADYFSVSGVGLPPKYHTCQGDFQQADSRPLAGACQRRRGLPS